MPKGLKRFSSRFEILTIFVTILDINCFTLVRYIRTTNILLYKIKELDENIHVISLLFNANVNHVLRESKYFTFFNRKDVNRQWELKWQLRIPRIL